MPPDFWPVVSSPLGGGFVSTRAGAEGSEGVPSGRSTCGRVGGLLQDHGPGQDVCLQSSFILQRPRQSSWQIYMSTVVPFVVDLTIALTFVLFSRRKECWSSSRQSQRRLWGALWLWLLPEVEASLQHWGWLSLELWLSGTDEFFITSHEYINFALYIV